MDATIWVAIITVIGTIAGLIITKVVRDRNAQPDPGGAGTASTDPAEAVVDRVRGGIEKPLPNQPMSRTCQCSGWATNLEPGQHLWLAVEAGDFVWFKEGELHVDGNNRWEAIIFEDGATQAFSLSLFVADEKAQKLILDWFQIGYSTGEYPERKRFAGARRVTRVDGLRLNKLA